jgi:rubrerythrin
MAESKELLKELESLSHLDIDAVHAYTSAIDHIDLAEVKEQLISFRGDHQRHITDLAPLIERLGGTPPKQSPDFKGFLIQGFTAIRSMVGNESAIKAMKGNEELTNKTYDKALMVDFPDDIKVVIQKNRDDERRHLEYINRCIDERVWERPEKVA